MNQHKKLLLQTRNSLEIVFLPFPRNFIMMPYLALIGNRIFHLHERAILMITQRSRRIPDESAASDHVYFSPLENCPKTNSRKTPTARIFFFSAFSFSIYDMKMTIDLKSLVTLYRNTANEQIERTWFSAIFCRRIPLFSMSYARFSGHCTHYLDVHLSNVASQLLYLPPELHSKILLRLPFRLLGSKTCAEAHRPTSFTEHDCRRPPSMFWALFRCTFDNTKTRRGI